MLSLWQPNLCPTCSGTPCWPRSTGRIFEAFAWHAKFNSFAIHQSCFCSRDFHRGCTFYHNKWDGKYGTQRIGYSGKLVCPLKYGIIPTYSLCSEPNNAGVISSNSIQLGGSGDTRTESSSRPLTSRGRSNTWNFWSQQDIQRCCFERYVRVMYNGTCQSLSIFQNQ